MTRDGLLNYCGSLAGATEDYPFGDGVAVFKVGGRMFALVSLEGDPGSVNLKCDPGLALELRARYAAVRPGAHQNKRHWNTVDLDGSIHDDELQEMVEHSYGLVVDGLPRAQRARLHGESADNIPKGSRKTGTAERLATEALDGGDPACWAHFVCPECGRVSSEGHAEGCGTATESFSG
jgi:predicted DNA-binding protein (MmcQ/YjbR family)